MPNAWQTFFNLAGVAGATSLIWQICAAFQTHRRRARLRIMIPDETDIFDISWKDPVEERRYITCNVKNVGRRTARGCVARAIATSVKAAGQPQEVPLHWADTELTYNTTGCGTVDIPPGSAWRLDVAISRSPMARCWLASIAALRGEVPGLALPEGAYNVEIIVTFDDGNEDRVSLRLGSPTDWHGLYATVVPRQLVRVIPR
jgi:hypothetical protein